MTTDDPWAGGPLAYTIWGGAGSTDVTSNLVVDPDCLGDITLSYSYTATNGGPTLDPPFHVSLAIASGVITLDYDLAQVLDTTNPVLTYDL